jgi:hypothetical protein
MNEFINEVCTARLASRLLMRIALRACWENFLEGVLSEPSPEGDNNLAQPQAFSQFFGMLLRYPFPPRVVYSLNQPQIGRTVSSPVTDFSLLGTFV